MKSRWNDENSKQFLDSPLALRAYTSRLLGAEPSLVLHGGGNTSVKVSEKNIFGDIDDILYVKGSGWDLKTIEPPGFSPVKMNVLLKLARLSKLSDSDMVKEQKAAMTDTSKPGPSVEAILHAIIPFKFVEHTHADAVVTVSNQPDGEKKIQEIFGNSVIVVPYVMPGFILARKVFEQTQDLDWKKYEGMILLNHGVFTFSDNAKDAYEKMISLVSKAEAYLEKSGAAKVKNANLEIKKEMLIEISKTRKSIGKVLGKPCSLVWDTTSEAVGFSSLANVDDISTRGTVTPDHVIYTKPFPLIHCDGAIDSELEIYKKKYQSYYERNASAEHKILDLAPRVIIWKNHGVISVGNNPKTAHVISDVNAHTRRCIQWGENLGRWQPLNEKNLFEVEYWELEQAKLKMVSSSPTHQGKIALVTGAASGIGKACVMELLKNGSCVAAIDINPTVKEISSQPEFLGISCDVTDSADIERALNEVIKKFGGLDILVSNAGTFPPGKKIDSLDDDLWEKTLNVNLTSHFKIFRAAIPFLKNGFDPSLLIVGSKNVKAPGPGAAAYSAAKAGLTQLARIAALELAEFGIRVNVVHPDAVFDTGVWTKEVLENRAKHYGMSVDQYKSKNLLHTEIKSTDVATLISLMASHQFAKSTGVQISIDGGNDRVI